MIEGSGARKIKAASIFEGEAGQTAGELIRMEDAARKPT